jgi:ribosomal-protein-alanine N-acetyltransferase
MPWLPFAHEDVDQTRAWLSRSPRMWTSGRAYTFVIVHRREAIGTVGFRPSAAGSAETGYWIDSGHAGQGFVTEAMEALIGFAFNVLGLARLELITGVDNAPSVRLAERLGFQLEGRLRSAGLGADGRYDCFLYGLLSSDRSPSDRLPPGR